MSINNQTSQLYENNYENMHNNNSISKNLHENIPNNIISSFPNNMNFSLYSSQIPDLNNLHATQYENLNKQNNINSSINPYNLNTQNSFLSQAFYSHNKFSNLYQIPNSSVNNFKNNNDFIDYNNHEFNEVIKIKEKMRKFPNIFQKSFNDKFETKFQENNSEKLNKTISVEENKLVYDLKIKLIETNKKLQEIINEEKEKYDNFCINILKIKENVYQTQIYSNALENKLDYYFNIKKTTIQLLNKLEDLFRLELNNFEGGIENSSNLSKMKLKNNFKNHGEILKNTKIFENLKNKFDSSDILEKFENLENLFTEKNDIFKIKENSLIINSNKINNFDLKNELENLFIDVDELYNKINLENIESKSLNKITKTEKIEIPIVNNNAHKENIQLKNNKINFDYSNIFFTGKKNLNIKKEKIISGDKNKIIPKIKILKKDIFSLNKNELTFTNLFEKKKFNDSLFFYS